MDMLSFVIPCYGSELTIENVLDEIHEVMSQKPEYDYEIICVNDDSPDKVLEVLKNRVKSDPRLIVADLTRNMGKASAQMAGFSLVSGDIIINLDDDGQCPMHRLWDLLTPLLAPLPGTSTGNHGTNQKTIYDVSTAYFTTRKHTTFRDFGSKVNTMMSRFLIGRPKDLRMSSFIAIKRFVIDEMLRYQNPYPYIEGLMLRTTRTIAQIPMEERERIAGKSNFTFGKSLGLWLNGFTAFSVKPLRLASLLGVIISMIGVIAGIVMVIRRLFITPDMPLGYPSLLVTVLFIGGIIMMMLGMLGEYIGRMYICMNNSPQYVIREIIRADNT